MIAAGRDSLGILTLQWDHQIHQFHRVHDDDPVRPSVCSWNFEVAFHKTPLNSQCFEGYFSRGSKQYTKIQSIFSRVIDQARGPGHRRFSTTHSGSSGGWGGGVRRLPKSDAVACYHKRGDTLGLRKRLLI